MNGLEINRAIAALIKERIPKKSKAVNLLSEILGLSTKAVYRRLNDEVFFTFAEVCKLFSEFGISLDGFIQHTITGIDSNGVLGLPKDAKDVNYATRAEGVFSVMKQTIKRLVGCTYSEAGMIANSIPHIFFCYDKELFRYSIYYTNYRYVNTKTYSDFKKDRLLQFVVDEIYNLYTDCLDIKHHSILMTREPIRKVMVSINYMRKIHSLTDEEYQSLKWSLSKFINRMEVTADTGFLPDSNTKCNIYLSDVSLSPNCHFLYSEEISLSSIQMYLLGWKISFDRDHNNEIRNWFDVWKHNSVLITKSNINERIQFIKSQREELEQ